MTKQYTPIKVGKSGKVVHAGIVSGTHTRNICGRTITEDEYRPICTVTNTHNVNQFPWRTVGVLKSGTPITCKHCLEILAKQEATI